MTLMNTKNDNNNDNNGRIRQNNEFLCDQHPIFNEFRISHIFPAD